MTIVADRNLSKKRCKNELSNVAGLLPKYPIKLYLKKTEPTSQWSDIFLVDVYVFY